jgi:hypothetical protein
METKFISFVGAFYMTLDIIKTKWKGIFCVIAAMFGVAYLSLITFNFSLFGRFPSSLRGTVWNYAESLIPCALALFFGFLFIVYITESYFRGKKETFENALLFLNDRVKNYIYLTSFFVLAFTLLNYVSPKILVFFSFIFLFRYAYSYFASAFFNCDIIDSFKKSAELTKGRRLEIFMRSVILAFTCRAFTIAASVVVSIATSNFFYGYRSSLYYNAFLILAAVSALVFFVLFNSVMFLSLFNVKRNNLS